MTYIPESKRVNKEKTHVVSFLDVLGWKGIWQRNKNAIDDLEAIVGELIRITKRYEVGLDEGETKILVISDTLVFLTQANDSNVTDKLEFHGKLCKIAIFESIAKGIPLRGATSYGEVASSEKYQIFAGIAVDEAASWHEKADWIGVFMTPSASFIFDNPDSSIWVQGCPPLKDKIDFKTFSLLWFDLEHIENAIKECKKNFVQQAPIFPELIPKFTNTIRFMESFISGKMDESCIKEQSASKASKVPAKKKSESVKAEPKKSKSKSPASKKISAKQTKPK